MEFWLIAAYCALAVAAFGYRNDARRWEYRARRAENEIDILNRVRLLKEESERTGDDDWRQRIRGKYTGNPNLPEYRNPPPTPPPSQTIKSEQHEE